MSGDSQYFDKGIGWGLVGLIAGALGINTFQKYKNSENEILENVKAPESTDELSSNNSVFNDEILEEGKSAVNFKTPTSSTSNQFTGLGNKSKSSEAFTQL